MLAAKRTSFSPVITNSMNRGYQAKANQNQNEITDQSGIETTIDGSSQIVAVSLKKGRKIDRIIMTFSISSISYSNRCNFIFSSNSIMDVAQGKTLNIITDVVNCFLVGKYGRFYRHITKPSPNFVDQFCGIKCSKDFQRQHKFKKFF